MVNHACNLRCSYCYTGAKFSSPMPRQTGEIVILRALQSLFPDGSLNLGFFGGEPLLEAQRILDWMEYARNQACNSEKHVSFTLTTNGTISNPHAWQVMMADNLELAVSFDGTPQMHDRHRHDSQGKGSAALVEATIRKLVNAGREFRVITVVRPDNLEEIPAAMEYLHALGVHAVNLSLDLWTSWTANDGSRLRKLVTVLSKQWARWLPKFSLNWFDSKIAEMTALQKSPASDLCGFGDGEIAVAPSGRLYPCERLIGEDRPGNPLRLPGSALDGRANFLDTSTGAFVRCSPCSQCALASACDTFCRCSNFVRTGDTNRPDGLLCLLNKAAASAVAEILNHCSTAPSPGLVATETKENCYV
jgi:uncharacterized protein